VVTVSAFTPHTLCLFLKSATPQLEGVCLSFPPSHSFSSLPLHSLYNTNIGASGAAAIGEALKCNKTLAAARAAAFFLRP
jgi:hypothetical protein